MNKPDMLAELMTGVEGSIRFVGRMVLMPQGQIDVDQQVVHKTCLFGVVSSKHLPVLDENSKFSELWECEVLVKPIRKWSAHKKEDERGSPTHETYGLTVGTILKGGLRYDGWGEQYYGKEES